MDSIETRLLASDEPWTRYRTLIDLLGVPENDPRTQQARREMLTHPQVKALLASASTWGKAPVARHNDAGHAFHVMGVLADFGLQLEDHGMKAIVQSVLAHDSAEGAFCSPVKISPSFGGSGKPEWLWMACDAPLTLRFLLAMGLANEKKVQRAIQQLLANSADNGWRCTACPQAGKFHGPGRKDDPCPIANVYALDALSWAPEAWNHPAVSRGVEMLLGHWQLRKSVKHYLFGIGTDFHKLKYPLVWYDILHVTDVLSRFPFVRKDRRLRQMAEAIRKQVGADGRYTAGSMYQAWRGWSFANKKEPSPWLSFLVFRIVRRL
jgi:hypothetical protein